MAREVGLASQFSSDAATIRAIYDDWSSLYDHDLASWGYEAPRVAVEYLAAHAAADGQILDAGCGTGLVGAELAAAGFHDVFGIDLSAESLDIAAASSHYRAVAEHDLTDLPTALLDASFDGVICVGVMTYMADVEGICREFCRVVRSGGVIVLSQRSDLFVARRTQEVFDALASEGVWAIVEVTDGRPYLPGHAEYDGIDVHYGIFRRQ